MIICLECGLEFNIIIVNDEEEEIYVVKYCPVCGKDDLDTESNLNDIILGVN